MDNSDIHELYRIGYKVYTDSRTYHKMSYDTITH